jgi:glutathione S-transferase
MKIPRRLAKLGHTLQVMTSTTASSIRFWSGTQVHSTQVSPARRLELYDNESDPECRLVREALTELDLDVLIYPCPLHGQRFRPRALEISGQPGLPVLVEPDTGHWISGSSKILEYLFSNYAQCQIPLHLRPGLLQKLSSRLSTTVRHNHGRSARPSATPGRPLTLFSFESSPFSRLVREVLCELELPYELKNLGKTRRTDYLLPGVRRLLNQGEEFAMLGRNRNLLKRKTGKVQVPYLIDPNTGIAMFESAQINAYLESTYAL